MAYHSLTRQLERTRDSKKRELERARDSYRYLEISGDSQRQLEIARELQTNKQTNRLTELHIPYVAIATENFAHSKVGSRGS